MTRFSRTPTILKLPTFLAFAALGLTGAAYAQEFHYSGDSGPAHWAELNAAWDQCGGAPEHISQSPINIAHARFDKSLNRLDLRTFPTTIDIFNNGHTIEQHYEDGLSSIRFEGVEYDLKQFHFHTLSEHTIDGEHGVMEMHAVFGSQEGTNLVVGMLFELGWYNNSFIQKLIDAGLPETSESEPTVTADLIDLADAFTDTKSYYTYGGSLTTPPCSQTVTWIVLTRPARLHRNQLEEFRRILGNNFRPVQRLNQRVVRVTKPSHGK